MKLTHKQREAILVAYESFLADNKKDNPDPDNGGGYFHEYLFNFLSRALEILEVIPVETHIACCDDAYQRGKEDK